MARPEVLLGVALIVPTALASVSQTFPLEFEFREGLIFEERGQRTCLRESWEGEPSPLCPLEDSGVSYPSLGIRILDAWYALPWGPADPAQAVREVAGWNPQANLASIPSSLLEDLQSGRTPERMTGGAFPPVIFPGAGTFRAILGYYSEISDSGGGPSMTFSMKGWRPLPDNEFWPAGDVRIVSYLDPGSHPVLDSRISPADGEPDFEFRWLGASSLPSPLYEAGHPVLLCSCFDSKVRVPGLVLFYDGSLLRPLTMTTVSDPILAPSSDGAFPFRSIERSRIDVDDYVALFPEGPLAELGSVAAGVLEGLPPPSYALCPSQCIPGPLPSSFFPPGVGGAVALVESSIWGRYPRETDPGSENSAEGRLSEFQSSYHGWVDLRVRYVYGNQGYQAGPYTFELPPAQGGPPPSKDSQGTSTLPPGPFQLEVWLGIWRDLNLDGWIGSLPNPDDPYEGGSRPDPNSYENPRGEFIGIFSQPTLQARLIPLRNWGVGLWGTYPKTFLPWIPFALYGGDKPVNVTLSPHTDGVRGHYASPVFWLPLGSPGFRAVLEPVTVSFHEGGIEVQEVVFDSDTISPWF